MRTFLAWSLVGRQALLAAGCGGSDPADGLVAGSGGQAIASTGGNTGSVTSGGSATTGSGGSTRRAVDHPTAGAAQVKERAALAARASSTTATRRRVTRIRAPHGSRAA